jgi:hypothetical protein
MLLHQWVLAAIAILGMVGGVLDQRHRQQLVPPAKPGVAALFSAMLAGGALVALIGTLS